MIFKPFPDNDITLEDRLFVEEIQEMLRRLELEQNGASSVPTDGIYGPKTTEAVKNFQRAQGLPITGITDRNTYYRLVEAYNALLAKNVEVTPIYAFRPTDGTALRLGDTGDAVFFLNIMLSAIAKVFKNIPLPVVGNRYTEETAASVRALQQVIGLSPTGITDRRTWNRITALYNDLVYDLTVER